MYTWVRGKKSYEKRGNRNYGHFIGSRVVFDTLKTITELGVEYVTVYALSLENYLGMDRRFGNITT